MNPRTMIEWNTVFQGSLGLDKTDPAVGFVNENDSEGIRKDRYETAIQEMFLTANSQQLENLMRAFNVNISSEPFNLKFAGMAIGSLKGGIFEQEVRPSIHSPAMLTYSECTAAAGNGRLPRR